jgi:hypothetical protein
MCAVYLTLLLYLSRLKNVADSRKEPVQHGLAWRTTNHALDTSLQLWYDNEEKWEKLVVGMCPGDVIIGVAPGATWTIPANMICKSIVTIVWDVFHILAFQTKVVRCYGSLTISC